MKQEQTDFITKLKETKPLLFFKFVDETRKLYNQLCPACQKKIIDVGGKIDLSSFCEKCTNKARFRLEKQKEILEQAGAKFI